VCIAPNQPVHGSGAEVFEFDLDLPARGHDRVDAPNRLTVELSTDANNSFRIAVDPDTGFPQWRLDARIVRESIEIVQSFRDGSFVDDTPSWMEIVVEEARARLLEGSA
jgi:hypothetical protein